MSFHSNTLDDLILTNDLILTEKQTEHHKTNNSTVNNDQLYNYITALPLLSHNLDKILVT